MYSVLSVALFLLSALPCGNAQPNGFPLLTDDHDLFSWRNAHCGIASVDATESSSAPLVYVAISLTGNGAKYREGALDIADSLKTMNSRGDIRVWLAVFYDELEADRSAASRDDSLPLSRTLEALGLFEYVALVPVRSPALSALPGTPGAAVMYRMLWLDPFELPCGLGEGPPVLPDLVMTWDADDFLEGEFFRDVVKKALHAKKPVFLTAFTQYGLSEGDDGSFLGPNGLSRSYNMLASAIAPRLWPTSLGRLNVRGILHAVGYGKDLHAWRETAQCPAGGWTADYGVDEEVYSVLIHGLRGELAGLPGSSVKGLPIAAGLHDARQGFPELLLRNGTTNSFDRMYDRTINTGRHEPPTGNWSRSFGGNQEVRSHEMRALEALQNHAVSLQVSPAVSLSESEAEVVRAAAVDRFASGGSLEPSTATIGSTRQERLPTRSKRVTFLQTKPSRTFQKRAIQLETIHIL